MKYFFETYGCQMNKAESASIEQLFDARGWTAAKKAEEADIAILNTCTVRITAEQRIHGRIGWYTALKKEQKEKKEKRITLVVTGCMAERLAETLLKDFPTVDYVIGNFEKQRFADIAAALESRKKLKMHFGDEKPAYSFAPLSYEKGAFQAFVPIMHGCNNYCSYCIVPYVRGREVSRPINEILDEIDILSQNKVREITLLGQNVNSYSFEGLDFADLMQRIADHLRDTESSIGWVRFTSSHPKDVSDRLIDVLAKESVFCRHLHLPVQHGSTSVLEAMNRKYTREDYLALVQRVRSKLDNLSLTSDILIGFPGETEQDFEDTISLMKEVRFSEAYMYYYNPREGTKAFEMQNQVPLKIKKERIKQVVDTQLVISREEMRKREGTTLTVLVEGHSKANKKELLGRTEHDEHVVFEAPKELIGSFVQVTISELTGNTFRAKLRVV